MNVAKKVDGALLRTASKAADGVRAGVQESVDAEQVAQDFLHNFPAGSSITSEQGRTWARLHVRVSDGKLALALEQVHAQGWLMGSLVATAYYGEHKISKAAPSPEDIVSAMGIDWGAWTPGSEAAALLVRPPRGLARLLQRQAAQTGARSILKDISDTTLDRIGVALANGIGGVPEEDIAGGQGRSFIANLINEVLGDPQRALMIAQTEMSRALNVATMDSYNDFGVEYVEWLALEECALCAENAGAGPIPIGEPFPSGDTEPPGHPNCRCTIAPANPPGVSGSNVTENMTDNIELAVTPDRVKGVPGPLEVARALSRLEILPNPANPAITNVEKFVESPWAVVPVPTVDPNLWDDAVTAVVDLDDLYATDPYLKRKNVRKHIETMGQANTPFRSYALIAEVAGKLIIIDGHHRLMATWLLSQDTVAVYKIEIL